MRLKLFSALALLITLASCRVALVPKYDSVVMQSVKNGQALTNLLYDPANTAYNDSLYNIVGTQIANIKTAEASRLKSRPLVSIVNLLQSSFSKYRAQHRIKKTATEQDLKLWKLYLQPYWKDLITAENSLKH